MIDRNGKFFLGVTLRGPYAAVLAQPERGGGILVVDGFVDELSLPAVAEWCRSQLQQYAGTRYRAIANHGYDVGLQGYYDDVGEELTQPLADKLTDACRIFWQKAFESTRESRRQEIVLLLREGMQGEGAPRLGFKDGKAQTVIEAISRIEDPKADKIRDAIIDALGLAVFGLERNALGFGMESWVEEKPWYEEEDHND